MSSSELSGHLSIGEVLSLVQQDFPDVTISKIRFLESQGLIAPERTASGFRKFYGSDIDRLRWILRQQADHFLPLKVIKKMLEGGADTSASLGAQPTLWSSADDAEPSDPERPSAGASPDNSPTGSAENSPTGSAEKPAAGSTGKSAGKSGRSKGETDNADEKARTPSPSHPSVIAARAASDASIGGAQMAGRGDSTEGSSASEPVAAEPEARTQRVISTPADIVAALQEDPRPRRNRGSGSIDSGTPAESDEADSGASIGSTIAFDDIGVDETGEDLLSEEEMCERLDIGADLLAELEKFGLISPRRMGGGSAYDSSDVEIVRLTLRYIALGLEPRHLRMYKIAAEREAGFIEQLVVPLLKRRNPSARETAAERSRELGSLGVEMHNLILKRHLRSLLGSR